MQQQGSRRYAQILIERWWVIVICVVITVGAAALYVSRAHKQYSAQAQMLVSPVPQTDAGWVGLPVLHSSGDPTSDVLTAASLITSPSVASAVVTQMHLKETPNALLTDISATPIGQSNLVAVQADASSPRAAQALANQFVAQVVATRAAALHAAVAAQIPTLRAKLATLPRSEQSGPGTIGDQLSSLEQLQSSNDPTITVAASAALPTSPSSPKTGLTLAAALLGGLILGIGAAFGWDALDPRLRRGEQLKEIFDVPVLAAIPHQQRRGAKAPILPTQLTFGAAEGYRTLRTTLSSRATRGKPRSVLVTSSASGDGKTTSAINLAAALAQVGSRVTLVEADLRKPSIAVALGLALEHGIEDVLAGDVSFERALTNVTIGTANVRVLPVGQPGLLVGTAGAELADRLSFHVGEDLIRAALEVSDFVVVDSPPLNAVSDALPLARAADEVVVVGRVGQTKIKQLWELHDLLAEYGRPVTGTVLIGAARTSERSSRGGYYMRDVGERSWAREGLGDQKPTRHGAVRVVR